MNKLRSIARTSALLGSLFIILCFIFPANDNFKILRIKGQVTISDKEVKVGSVFPLAEIENLTVKTDDESGFVVICYKGCSKNKVLLEKTINYSGGIDKRRLLETTSFKTRGNKLSSFPELVNYFESKPIALFGDSNLEIKQAVLDFPKEGSYLDLYYTVGNEEVIHEIPFKNSNFLFTTEMFEKGSSEDNPIVGPVALTMIDPKASKENLITEACYFVLIKTPVLEKYIAELAALNLNAEPISDALSDYLLTEYPKYTIDIDFVKQFVESQL